MVIQRATIMEWPQIETLRYAYFSRMCLSVQRRPPEAVWFVAREGEAVQGCYCTQDEVELSQRWVLDFYIAPLSLRKRVYVAVQMRDAIYDGADADGLDVMFHVDPSNIDHLRSVMNHGDAKVVGIAFQRKARKSCPLPF
jgi:hypothetical protein